ncbi:MAG: hypothetical protein NE334_04115 [Lentisphaeraceae bacterium]|nr:hypothetical protein [Lentisphaeraceae bacterium]
MDPFDLNSLKDLAKKFNEKPKDTENSASEEEEFVEPEEKTVQAELPQITQLEEYNEFPKLDKFKTYNERIIRKVSKEAPQRQTQIKPSNCDLLITLCDTELLEPSRSQVMRTVYLKKSHAVFSGLDNCDSLSFTQDQIGSFIVTISKGHSQEQINLGCIVKFEFQREDFSNLILSSRDIDGDIAVVGASCMIEFRLSDNSLQETQVADIKKLSQTHGQIQKENEAASSFNWTL